MSAAAMMPPRVGVRGRPAAGESMPRVPWPALAARAGRSARGRHVRRGMLIVVVLVIMAVFALLGASFAFRMDAQRLSVQALADRQQARLAAESGLSRAILILREHRTEMDRWYDNPDDLRRILVWAPDKPRGADSLADQETVPGRPAWRFSVVRAERDPERNVTRLRYGMTDEAGKVNLNTANRAQLLRLFDQIRPEGVLPQELADALIDWRDSDDVMTSVYGAESSYYARLEPPYKAKNRPLETVEELLMVKNFNGRILYGEDYNRNGHLDANEDDGEEGAFPPDDGDGRLDQGLLPLVTVYSWDWNSANDNKVRLDINAVQFEQLLDGCASCDERFKIFFEPVLAELDEETIRFIAEAQKRGHKFRSIGEIWGLQVDEQGRTNYDRAWRAYAAEMKRLGAVAEEDALISEEPPGEQQGPGDGSTGPGAPGDARPGDETGGPDGPDDRQPDGRGRNEHGARDLGGEPDGGGPRERPERGRETRDRDERPDRGNRDGPGGGEQGRKRENDWRGGEPNDREGRQASPRARPGAQHRPDKEQRRRQAVRQEDEETEPAGPDAEPGEVDPTGEPGEAAEAQPQEGGEEDRPPAGEGDRLDTTAGPQEEQPPQDEQEEPEDAWDPATSITSPVGPDQMRVLLDRLTVERGSVLLGKINVNTAPRAVLMSIPGLTEQDVESILSKREQVSAAEKTTIAWLVTSGALKPEVFAVVSNRLTARSIQFRIESIGFADHVRTAHRIEAVVEMRGHTAQFRYYRDLTPLGIGFPVWNDKENDTFAYTP